MDLLPIPPPSTNKVNQTINLANDGGSKSNTGYFRKRASKEEHEEEKGKGDELNLSSAVHSEEQEEDIDSQVKKIFEKFKDFLKKIKEFNIKLFGLNKPKIENIYKQSNTKSL